jgi:hypothetical protein
MVFTPGGAAIAKSIPPARAASDARLSGRAAGEPLRGEVVGRARRKLDRK